MMSLQGRRKMILDGWALLPLASTASVCITFWVKGLELVLLTSTNKWALLRIIVLGQY